MTSLNLSGTKHYLESLKSLGIKLGDFYLLLGFEWSKSQKSTSFGRTGECYKNAYDLASMDRSLIYCEGYAISNNLFPMHHAWCVTKDDVVIDPTWENGGQYFGIPLDFEYVTNHILETKVWGVTGEMIPRKIINGNPSDFIHKDWVDFVNRDEWLKLSR